LERANRQPHDDTKQWDVTEVKDADPKHRLVRRFQNREYHHQDGKNRSAHRQAASPAGVCISCSQGIQGDYFGRERVR